MTDNVTCGSLTLATHDVDKYFDMLKAKFSDSMPGSRTLTRSSSDKTFERRSRSSRPLSASGSISHFVRRHHGLHSDEVSPRYYRYSMTEAEDFMHSRQRSLDLHERRSAETSHAHGKNLSEDGKHVGSRTFSLSNSYSSGDLRDFLDLNNNTSKDDLTSMHMERALNQGKLFSVTEQNRKRRRKYFEKERK